MKRIIIMFGVCLLIVGIVPLEAVDGRRSEAQRFQIGVYKKAIISGDMLYMNNAQDVVEPHSGRLILVPLTENATPQTWLSYLGVDGTEWSALKQQSVALYPFCWDIVGQYFIVINIEELGRTRDLRFALISIPLQDVPGLTQLDIFPEEYGRSDLFPLADLFSPLVIRPRDSVFFDIVPFDQQMFHLYTTYEGVMTVWDYDPAVHETVLTTDWTAQPSPFALLKTRQKSWSQISTFPIDFEGPFRVIQLKEKTYIFSEHVRTIYLLEGERL